MRYSINDFVYVKNKLKKIIEIEIIDNVYVFYLSDKTSCGLNQIKPVNLKKDELSYQEVKKFFIESSREIYEKGVFSISNEPVIEIGLKSKKETTNFFDRCKKFFGF